jgi:hypothetical protein
LHSTAVAHLAKASHEPSPRRCASLVAVSINSAAWSSRPRKTASARAAVGAMLIPIAWLTDSTCATMAAAAPSSPANRCGVARMVKASGSAVSAPASRATSIQRSDSPRQLS